MNYKKTILWSSLFIIIVDSILFFIWCNIRSFCGNNYECFNNLKEGLILPVIYLSICVLLSLIVLFFVSDRLKKIGLVSISIVSIPIILLVFTSPVNVGSFVPGGRVINTLYLMLFYPISTIISILISFLYFKTKNKKQILP